MMTFQQDSSSLDKVKQLDMFWSVGVSFENCEVKMRETMKSDNYQDQSKHPVGQRNGRPLQ